MSLNGVIESYNPVGRLLLVRFPIRVSPPEMRRFVDATTTLVQTLGAGVVTCSDLSRPPILAPDNAALLEKALVAWHPHMERMGTIVGSATFAMQFDRLLRGGSNTNHRAFRVVNECTAWLAEALSAHERTALAKFVAQVPELHA
jgi:hypothetical protein